MGNENNVLKKHLLNRPLQLVLEKHRTTFDRFQLVLEKHRTTFDRFQLVLEKHRTTFDRFQLVLLKFLENRGIMKLKTKILIALMLLGSGFFLYQGFSLLFHAEEVNTYKID